MGFKIDKKAYAEQSGAASRQYVSLKGTYKVSIDAAKVVTRRAGDKMGIVEATILEGPEGGHTKGTLISWATALAANYNYQERDLKNFSQSALRRQGEVKGLEITKDQLEDPDLPNSIFIDDEDFTDGVVPDSPAKGLEMTVRYDTVINKKTEKVVMVKNKEGDMVPMIRGVWQ